MTSTAAPGYRPSPSYAEATRTLCDAALARALDGPGPEVLAPLLRGRLAMRAQTVDLAADTATRDAAHELLTHGWTPSELHAFAAKRLDPAALGYLVDVLAAAAQWSAASGWLHELARLGGRVWWSVGEPHLGQWARRNELRRPDTIRVAVDVLALLRHLPRTDDALPDTPTAPDLPPGSLVQDERIVGRIDALLARANGTEFPEEASACAGKAQELMVRYATVPVPTPSAAAATAEALTRLVTESPAAAAKTLVAGARTGVSIGRTALTDPRRLVTVVGAEVAGLVQKAAAVLGTSAVTPAPRRRPLPLPAGS